MRLAQVPAENFHRSHAVVAMLLVDEGNKLGEKSHRSHYSFAAGPASNSLIGWWTILAQSVTNAPTLWARARCVSGVWRR